MAKARRKIAEPGVEEGGEDVVTTMPAKCVVWPCNGNIRPNGGFHRCDKCGGSYGAVGGDRGQ